MAVTAFKAIEEYFNRMHTDLIWPTVGPATRGRKNAPDKLVQFQNVLMRTYSKAVRIFEPVPSTCTCHTCQTNSDCNQDQVCIAGKCQPVEQSPSGDRQSSLREACQTDKDCDQDELCIDHICVPIGLNFSFAAVNEVPTYGDDLKDELLDYYRGIVSILFTGLGRKPGKLGAVRDLLMETYARMSKIVGTKVKPCNDDGDCNQDEVCVLGACVPIPYRLVYRPGSPRLRRS